MTPEERKIESLTEEALLAEIDRTTVGEGRLENESDTGFMSSREWAIRWNCSWWKAQERIRKMVALKYMTCQWHFRNTSDGRRQRRATYSWINPFKSES